MLAATADFLSLPLTGNAFVDVPQVRATAWVLGRLLGVHPVLVLAVMRGETDAQTGATLGDVGLAGGPSVGWMQVYYATAKRYGFFSGTAEEYAAMATDLVKTSWWGIQVLRDAIKQAQGDIAGAFSVYNSGTTHNAQGSYAQSKVAWLRSVGFPVDQSVGV